MPFKSKAQERWMFAEHPDMAARWAKDTEKKDLPEKKHHSGKGTRARLNTAAEKHFFRSRVSD